MDIVGFSDFYYNLGLRTGCERGINVKNTVVSGYCL